LRRFLKAPVPAGSDPAGRAGPSSKAICEWCIRVSAQLPATAEKPDRPKDGQIARAWANESERGTSEPEEKEKDALNQNSARPFF